MNPTRSIASVFAGTVTLFLWYGISQVFPWGPSVVSNFSATNGEPYVASASELVTARVGTWTTSAFDEQLGGRISTLATDQTFSWIISVPSDAYSLQKYFVVHAATQVGVALLLLATLGVLAPLSRSRRLIAVLLAGATTSFGVYGAMLNWLGMPAAYGVGQGFNHVCAWLLAGIVMDRIVGPAASGTSA